jgi:hypothetical protein
MGPTGLVLRTMLAVAVVVVAFSTRIAPVGASWDTCEQIDGDCPDNCTAAGFNGTLGFTALLSISPTHPDIQAMAVLAENYIVSQGTVQVRGGCFVFPSVLCV